MRLFILSLLFLVAIVLAPAICSAQLNKTKFGADSFRHRIKLTDQMLKGLGKAPEFADCYKFASDRLEATKIDLNGDRKPEILVMISCGNSSTTNLFWLLRQKKRNYEPVFNVATLIIYFKNTRHHGFRDIVATGCTANTCFYQYFSFNTHRYVRTLLKERPVP